MAIEPIDLFALEAELQAPASRRDPTCLEALLDPTFQEFGTSGVVYDRLATLSALQSGSLDDQTIEMRQRTATAISEDVVLLTYQALKRDRLGAEVSRSLRSSLWRRTDGCWSMLFHQGTAC